MTDSKLTAAVLCGAAAFLVASGIHATHGTFDDQLTTTVDYLNDGFFTLALLGSAAGAQLLGHHGAGSRGVFLATYGPLLVALGVLAGLILGHSPSWFAAVGVPGNLMWLAGLIVLAISTRRAGILPAPLAFALPLVVVGGLLLAEFGGSVVPAVLWVLVARRLGASFGGARGGRRAAVGGVA
jgi:hypothetical protein